MGARTFNRTCANRALRFALAVALAAALTTASMAMKPAPAHAGANYCGVLVLPYYDCANMVDGSIHVGHFNYNKAYYTGAGTVGVCEHTYLHYEGSTVSRRCANNAVGSACDLYYWQANGYTLGGHSPWTHTIWGWVDLVSYSCA
jgi:hypothetical protein